MLAKKQTLGHFFSKVALAIDDFLRGAFADSPDASGHRRNATLKLWQSNVKALLKTYFKVTLLKG
jgi:hypothetical protein